MPSKLQDRGVSAVDAGLALSVSILVQVVSAIAAPLIASQMRDYRAMIFLVMLLVIAGLAGCIYGPMEQMWLWVVLLGLGQGGSFSLALTTGCAICSVAGRSESWPQCVCFGRLGRFT